MLCPNGTSLLLMKPAGQTLISPGWGRQGEGQKHNQLQHRARNSISEVESGEASWRRRLEPYLGIDFP